MEKLPHIKAKWVFAACAIFLIVSIGISALTLSVPLELEAGETQSDTRREEVQRYFGYESLLFRYLTLPFDISLNVNQKGDFVDIGFLFITFVPILIFVILWKKKIPFILSAVLFGFFLIISVAHSNFIDYETLRALSGERNLTTYLEDHTFREQPINIFLVSTYLFFLDISGPIEYVFNGLTGDRDFISYPILLCLFLLSSFYLLKFLDNRDSYLKWSIIIAWVYGLFWFILASGIIWYGYMLFALGYIIILTAVSGIGETKGNLRILKIGFFILAGLWITTGFISRLSNVSLQVPEEHRGKGLILPSVYNYNLGRITSEAGLKKTLLPGLNQAMAVVNNSGSELVYRVGTSLTYFIRENHKRVIQDNQLGLFQSILNKYPDHQTVNEILKASNIHFLIVDLNTPSLDNTPEKSLLRKFQNLMNYVQNNQGLTLLGTDRIVSKPGADGKSQYYYDVFGDRVSNGTYAIYRID